MSLMTWITHEEVSLIARSSKRPRFALCVWLALLKLAEGGSEWQGSRGRVGEVASELLPPDRFAVRLAARIAGMSAAQEANRAVRAEPAELFDRIVEHRECDRVAPCRGAGRERSMGRSQ